MKPNILSDFLTHNVAEFSRGLQAVMQNGAVCHRFGGLWDSKLGTGLLVVKLLGEFKERKSEQLGGTWGCSGLHNTGRSQFWSPAKATAHWWEMSQASSLGFDAYPIKAVNYQEEGKLQVSRERGECFPRRERRCTGDPPAGG